ncbi:MAG: hypothetical protein AAF713_06035 [Pseudomonadota bacterium]
MNTMVSVFRGERMLPDLRGAHWLLRAALAAFIMYQGFSKAPISPDDAASFGVPVLLWIAAALGELVAGAALIFGGFLTNRIGDLITRAGGAMLALIVASVLVMVYWAPPLELFLGNQFHLLLLCGGLYFALRGNAA